MHLFWVKLKIQHEPSGKRSPSSFIFYTSGKLAIMASLFFRSHISILLTQLSLNPGDLSPWPSANHSRYAGCPSKPIYSSPDSIFPILAPPSLGEIVQPHCQSIQGSLSPESAMLPSNGYSSGLWSPHNLRDPTDQSVWKSTQEKP